MNKEIDIDRLMVRPTYRAFGIYEVVGTNKARVLFEGEKEKCYEKIAELRERKLEGIHGDHFTIYQLKDDESLHYHRFISYERLKKDNLSVDRENYDKVFEAPLRQGTSLEFIYYQFNMDHPLDFTGHSLSVSDVVVLHRNGEDRAYYVDSIGFTEVPEFLTDYEAEREAIAEFKAETDKCFNKDSVNGLQPENIEETVKDQVQQLVEDYGLDVKIEDVVITGSRARGLENDDSDLDIVVAYSGNEREDDFFNLLHDEKRYLYGVELDINPISREQTGSLADYLKGAEKYFAEKAREYKPLTKVEELEEQNYNMIDNVLNNIAPKPEEKGQEAQNKAEIINIAERGSMRKRLARKKAEVAEQDSRPKADAQEKHIAIRRSANLSMEK